MKFLRPSELLDEPQEELEPIPLNRLGPNDVVFDVILEDGKHFINDAFWPSHELCDSFTDELIDYLGWPIYLPGEGPWIIEGRFSSGHYWTDYGYDYDCELDWEVILSGPEAEAVTDLYELVKIDEEAA